MSTIAEVTKAGYGPVTSCRGCADHGASEVAVEYPCPTVAAVTEALEADR